MTLGVSLGIAKQALQVNQYAMNVVSNNIANMNTEGYSRQTVALEQTPPYTAYINGKMQNLGTGVAISDITRQRDSFLDGYYREQNTISSFYSTLESSASNISDIMNELDDSGLQYAYTNFFNSLEELATNPADASLRQNVVEQAKTLTNLFNSRANQLTKQRNQLVGDPTDLSGQSLISSKGNLTVSDINQKLEQITSLNHQIIINSASGSNTSALADTRDALLDELSAEIPITTTTNANGSVNILLDKHVLIQGDEQKYTLNAALNYTDDTHVAIDSDNPMKIQLMNMDGSVKIDNINDKITAGSLGAYLQISSGTTDELSYPNVLNDLNLMASEFAKALNDAQLVKNADGSPMAISVDLTTGKKTLKAATEELFSTNDGSATITASNISLNKAISDDPYLIAAARVEEDPANPGQPIDPNAIGNSNNANLMASIFEQNLPGLGGTSLNTYLSNEVIKIGNQVKTIESNASVTQSATDQTDSQRLEKMGVNLDEELMNLIVYQRAYEASARVFSAASEMMALLTTLGQ